MLSLESSLSSVVVDGKFDVVREEEQVQDTRDIHRLMHDGAAESDGGDDTL
jgi:hypothetical protein